MVELNERIAKLEADMESQKEWKDEFLATLKEINSRVFKVERFMWVAFGIVAVLQFVAPLIWERTK